jgi:hypothetical protein
MKTRNHIRNVVTCTAMVTFSGLAQADLAGVIGDDSLRYYEEDGTTSTSLEQAAYAVIDLRLDFSAPDTHGQESSETLLNTIRNFNISVEGFDLFNQSDLAGTDGSWDPTRSENVTGVANSVIDSFVTIGGGVGADAASNDTLLGGAAWGTTSGPDIFNGNVRWANYNPAQTRVDDQLQVWIGRFVVTGDEARNGVSFSVEGRSGYRYFGETGHYFEDFSGSFSFIPAPGALPLIGLAGSLARRRRS